MNPATNHFTQLLEQYVFKVANHHIDSADATTQPGMIDLWRTISDTLNSEAPPVVSSPVQPTEWAAVLQESVDWHSVDKQWIQGIMRARSRQHIKYLDRLKQALAATDCRLQALQTSQLSEGLRSRLSTHYQQTLLMYQQQLTQAERIYAAYFTDSTTDRPQRR